MKVRDYLSSAIWDLVLCLCMSVCLVITTCEGFYVPASVQFGYVRIILLCLLLCAILVFAAFNKRTVIIGGIAFVVVAAFLVGIGIFGTARTDLTQDIEANEMTFYLILVGSCLVVFLLSRLRIGSVILLVIGCVDCAAIQFLYLQWLLPEFIIFVVAAVINLMFRNYLRSVRDSQTAHTSFVAMVATAAVICALAVGAGFGIFYGIIAPLNPPARELILITDYKARPEIEIEATEDLLELLEDQLSNEEPEEDESTNVPEEDEGDESPEENEGDLETAEETGGLSGTDDGNNRNTQNITYERIIALGFLILLLIFLIFVLPILIKRYLRTRRYRRMCALEPRLSAIEFYVFFVKRFGKVGLAKVKDDTPREYVEHIAPYLILFDEAAENADFASLTGIYERAAYGHADPSEEEIEQFKRYYKPFFRSCRKRVGTPKFLLRFLFFRL